MAQVGFLSLCLCKGIGLLVWVPGDHSHCVTFVGKERRDCSFWPRRSLTKVLATFLGPGKVSGSCLCVGSLLATGVLAVRLEMGMSIWQAFLATLLVYALINVGGGMYSPYAAL